MPITVSPRVSACATHSMAHTCVTTTTAPGRAARNSAVSLTACSRMLASRARPGRGGCPAYNVVIG